ncbi:S41 family peptidase [Olivibacter sitiensis]|uniref:S41 family peptidase n=1 Tax=Olivibacter sitiensis TaxID=376470 RepID=UPI000685E9F9|nr:S41 family peptidase [Olivibacter sitiensis]
MKSSIKHYVLPFAVIMALVLTGYSFKSGILDLGKQVEVFAILYKQVTQNYVGEFDDEKIMRKGIDAMLGELDPYTQFIPSSEIEDFKIKYINAQYAGLGAVILSKGGKTYISEPYEGFPAEKSGLRAGDRLIKVDSIDVQRLSGTEISNLLKGPVGSSLRLEIDRSGHNEHIVKNIVRQEITQPNVSFSKKMEGHIGYIKLDRFLENAADEVANTIEGFLSTGKLQGLVLDLRNNGGGILQESVKIVNLFVEKGRKVVTQKGKNNRKQIVYQTTSEALIPDVPLIVLVNGRSASAAEIVAGALQDLDRAVVIGNQSFGKGLVQQTFQLPYDNMVKVTVAKYYTPSGRCIQAIDYDKGERQKGKESAKHEYLTSNGRFVYDGSGICPDVEVESNNYSDLSQALVEEYLLFDFATQFRNKHKSIGKLENFKLDSIIYEQFVQFVLHSDFDYKSTSDSLLYQLGKALKNEKKWELTQPEIQALTEKLNKDLKGDLYLYKDEIAPLLANEIVSRYYFQKGRMELAVKDDEALRKAYTILKNPTASYTQILKGEGTYRYIGKKSPLLAHSSERDN